MVVQSMTGYGSGEQAPYRVEIRGTNQKHLDVQVKAGQAFLPMEAKIRDRVRGFFHRGRLEIFVRQTAESGSRFRVSDDVAGSVVDSLRALKAKYGLAGELDLGTVASVREVFSADEVEADSEAFWPALEVALEQMKGMREREGAALADDVLARIDAIEARFRDIAERSEDIREGLAEGLRQRIQNLLADVPVDEVRLAQEIVFYVDRSDITEELVRVKSHLDQFRKTLQAGGVVGKKLDFLSQEILRETNTVGSKASDSSIAHLVVDIKTELEKIREQLQNLE